MDYPDVLLKVLSFLDTTSLSRCERVCRQWHTIIYDNINSLWLPHSVELSPKLGKPPLKWEEETWKNVCRRRWQWAVVLPRLARESIGSVGTELDGVSRGEDNSLNNMWDREAIAQGKLAQIATLLDGFEPPPDHTNSTSTSSVITVMGSYSLDNKHYIQPQSTSSHALVHCEGYPIGSVSLAAPSNIPYIPLKIQPRSERQEPIPQRLTRSKWIPVSEGVGHISIWDPSHPALITSFRAINEFYVQGHLCGTRYACFNPRWAAEEENVDCFQSIRMWDINAEEKSAKAAWTVRLPGHIVDVAINEQMVACAYGSLISDENLAETHTTAPLLDDEDRVFGLQFRDVRDGSLIGSAPAFEDVTDIICIALTRFYCVVTKAEGSQGGQAVLLVDLKSGDIVFEIDLATMFIEGYGGLRVSDCETYMLLWSSRNQLAVIDLEEGVWRLCERKVDGDADEWPFGFWATRRLQNGMEEVGRLRTVGHGKSLLDVAWKATPKLTALNRAAH